MLRTLFAGGFFRLKYSFWNASVYVLNPSCQIAFADVDSFVDSWNTALPFIIPLRLAVQTADPESLSS